MNALADPAEVRAHLLAAASAGTTISYSQLLGQLGFAFSRPKMRALCAVLGTVDHEAEALGEPELAVLVVRQSDGLPGQGWWVAGGAKKHCHAGTWEGPKARRLVEEHLLNEREFWLPYPVPSVAATEPSFDPEHHTGVTWRGPTWVNVNWYLYWGLRGHGYTGVASELARRTLAMVAQGGIREHFNPYTAAGQGAPDFGWTTLVLDLIAAEGLAGSPGHDTRA